MVLSWLTLNYKDKEEEEWYRKWAQDSQTKQMFSLSICSAIARLAGILWLSKFPKFLVLHIQLILGLSPIQEIILIVISYYKKSIAWILSIILITAQLAQFIELVKLLFTLVFEHNLKGLNLYGSFYCGIFYSFIELVFIMAKIPWIYCFWLISGSYIYSILRLNPADASYYASTLIALSGVCIQYFRIKREKEQIHEIQCREKGLEQQKNILDLMLPVPIVICQKKPEKIEYLFQNKAQAKLTESIASDPFLSLKKVQPRESREDSPRRRSISNKGQVFQEFQSQNEQFFEKMLNESTLHIFEKSECILKSKIGEIEESIRQFNVNGTKILYQKEFSYLFLLEEITVFKELDQYKDNLLTTVSHDLRTPLQGSLAMMECAIDSDNMTKIKKFLKLANKCGKGLLMLVNDLLDFSQIINGKLSLNRETVLILPLLKEVIKLIKFQAKMKGIAFIFENLLPNGNAEIHTDPNRLKQILQNLLGNALKFTKKGFIKLEISLEAHLEENQIKLSIEDSGIGITPVNLTKLFKMFGKLEQEDASVNKNGVGLGLSICQAISKMLNTKGNINGIKVKSEFGKGSTFQFQVPANKSVEKLDFNSSVKIQKGHCLEEWEARLLNIEQLTTYSKEKNKENLKSIELEDVNFSSEKKITFNPIDFAKLKCLAIDDDQTSLLAITSQLNALNINQNQCSSGEEAIEIISREIEKNEEKIFDFILMDNEMPVMSGLETSRKIANKMSSLHKKLIPIVILSGDSVEIDESIGIRSSLQKPVSKAQLSNTIAHMMNI